MKRLHALVLSVMSLFLLAGCQQETTTEGAAVEQQTFQWKMVTSWPKNFPGLGTGAEYFAQTVNEMSGGRLQIRVYGAGELVPALEVLDAVSQGTAEVGHSTQYYWKGKMVASQFFTTVPFGMTAQEMNSWMQFGGGQELMQQLYDPFNVVVFVGGNTGMQMAGWFNKEINNVNDLKGLKMRIPGLGGEILARAGGTPIMLPGGEIFTALQTGTIDATEWVGPYNDLAFGLHKAAKYYYYPGWHEPGSLLEFTINKQAYAKLPKDLQAIVKGAAAIVTDRMLAEMTARNQQALDELVNRHGVQLRELPADALAHLKTISEQVLEEVAKSDPQAQKVYASMKAYQEKIKAYHEVSEHAYLNARQ